MKFNVLLSSFTGNYKWILSIYIILSFAASSLSLLAGKKNFSGGEQVYTHYNNYVIFKQSFFHLKDNKDLYICHPEEHWDLYKYSPTFAVFFGVFAVFPDWLGLHLWNLLNALALLAAVYYLPRLEPVRLLDAHKKGLLLLFCAMELMTAMQNEQSNALMAGLFVGAVALMERGKYFWAVFCLVFSVYIKLFGLVAFALFLLYPQKWKTTLYTVFWTLFLFVIPLFFVAWEQYVFLWKSYGKMLSEDHSGSYGYSVMGWLYTWFGLEANKLVVVSIGILLLMLPYLRWQQYQNADFRLLALASMLIWVVIFNHKAESPTFVIAMAGAALWFMLSEKNAINILLFVLVFIFTSLSPTDLFPRFLREQVVNPYTLKAVPCILVWLKILWDMKNIGSISADEK